MSAAILDRARAFEMIAQHLDETKRSEIANAIGDKLLTEVQSGRRDSGATGQPRGPVVLPPSAEDERMVEAVKFLEEKGYSEGDLVRAAGRLATWLKSDAYKTLPHVARLQTWWATQREGRPE